MLAHIGLHRGNIGIMEKNMDATMYTALGFQDLRFWVWGPEFGLCGLGYVAWGLGFGVVGLGL